MQGGESVLDKNKIEKTTYIKLGNREEWRNKAGQLHNKTSPAYIEYNDQGQVTYESYYIDGKFHNENGPARIWYNSQGQVTRREYYLNGVYKGVR